MWSSDDSLYTLVAIGLGCCAEDPEDRMRLRVARARLGVLQRILRRTTGVMSVSVTYYPIAICPVCGQALSGSN